MDSAHIKYLANLLLEVFKQKVFITPFVGKEDIKPIPIKEYIMMKWNAKLKSYVPLCKKQKNPVNPIKRIINDKICENL